MFERKGLQTAAILTDTFRRPGDAMARVQGFANYRYAVMTHPISSLDPEQIRARAREALPEVLSILGLEQDGRAGQAGQARQEPVGAADGHRHA
jgi:hypothetical protein